MLLGGAVEQYRDMYENALAAMKRNIFYRPMTRDGKDVLFAGNVDSDGETNLNKLKPKPEAQHVGCFAGGMVSIAAKIFENEEDLKVGKKLVEGCLWGYEGMAQGIMPEIITTLPCHDTACEWDEDKWVQAMNDMHGTVDLDSAEAKRNMLGLPYGIMRADDSRYILRSVSTQKEKTLLTFRSPEAIESIFILYRITGDHTLQDRAWNMFNNIISRTKTDIAHAALDDCTKPEASKSDRMESFWLAETLKYFYLIFSEPSLISLDEYVLNTEAHPLKRPR
jgi:mannosyl-oligosaccharide alpha-1,2-mannosidase